MARKVGRPRHDQVSVDISIMTNDDIFELAHLNDGLDFPEDPSSFASLHKLGKMNNANAKKHMVAVKEEIRKAIHYDMNGMREVLLVCKANDQVGTKVQALEAYHIQARPIPVYLDSVLAALGNVAESIRADGFEAEAEHVRSVFEACQKEDYEGSQIIISNFYFHLNAASRQITHAAVVLKVRVHVGYQGIELCWCTTKSSFESVLVYWL